MTHFGERPSRVHSTLTILKRVIQSKLYGVSADEKEQYEGDEAEVCAMECQ